MGELTLQKGKTRWDKRLAVLGRAWYNVLMFNRLTMFFSLIAVVVILAMMNLTTPSGVGPLGVLVFFTMVYVVAYGISLMIVQLFMKLLGKKNVRKGGYFAAVVAFSSILILLAISFESVNILTLAGIAIFVFLGCFVVEKRL